VITYFSAACLFTVMCIGIANTYKILIVLKKYKVFPLCSFYVFSLTGIALKIVELFLQVRKHKTRLYLFISTLGVYVCVCVGIT